MVKPILLAKMLHCKVTRERSTRSCKSKQKHRKEDRGKKKNSCESEIKIEVEVEKYEFNLEQNICRVCLKEGDISIFDTNEDLVDGLTTFAGIEVTAEDNYPKYLCGNCHDLVKGAILLRKTALQSDEILKAQQKLIIQPNENENSTKLAPFLPEDNHDDREAIFEDSYDSLNEKMYEKMEEDKDQPVFYCKRCEITFENKEQLVEHKMSEEHENKRFTCKICNKTYSALYFKRHMSLHQLTPSHICDICGKKFVVPGQFTRHHMTHFYSLPFKCPLCPYKGRFSESLKMHMRSHTGEKPYQCTECPHRFVNKSNLNKHMLTHKREHDYKCDSCGRGFYTKRDLELHFKVDHTGIKEHVCNICGKAFGYRKQMMKHQLKVHKREKLRSGRLPLYLVVESKKQKGEEIE